MAQSEVLIDGLRQGGWLSRTLPKRAAPNPNGRLAGLTFVAKDLFDVAGLPTVAGSASNLDAAPALEDAQVVAALNEAGAELIALSNMDPLAYGFVTNNPLYGPARNPHDKTRICGGSSGGSAGAVASGLVDFAIGTDTSGSIRVPAAFTGIFGFKPTQGLISAVGAAPLSPTLDRVGVFATNTKTLLNVVEVLAGWPRTEASDSAIKAPKLGRLAGYFAGGLDKPIAEAFDNATSALSVHDPVVLPGSAKARAAAYILVAHEAAQTHADKLRCQLASFDSDTRARLIAGAAIAAPWLQTVHHYRETYTRQLERAFDAFDFIVAPTTACVAPHLRDLEEQANPKAKPLRATLGQYTQPISLTGYPVLSVPISVPGTTLPTALQVIARPGADIALLQFGQTLEGLKL